MTGPVDKPKEGQEPVAPPPEVTVEPSKKEDKPVDAEKKETTDEPNFGDHISLALAGDKGV